MGPGGDQELNLFMKLWYLVVEIVRTLPEAGNHQVQLAQCVMAATSQGE